MSEAAGSLLFDLANAFAGDAEALTDLLQRQRIGFAEAEVEAEDLGFSLAEGAEGVFDGAGEGFGVEVFVGSRGEGIADVVEKLALLAGDEGGVEGDVDVDCGRDADGDDVDGDGDGEVPNGAVGMRRSAASSSASGPEGTLAGAAVAGAESAAARSMARTSRVRIGLARVRLTDYRSRPGPAANTRHFTYGSTQISIPNT